MRHFEPMSHRKNPCHMWLLSRLPGSMATCQCHVTWYSSQRLAVARCKKCEIVVHVDLLKQRVRSRAELHNFNPRCSTNVATTGSLIFSFACKWRCNGFLGRSHVVSNSGWGSFSERSPFCTILCLPVEELKRRLSSPVQRAVVCATGVLGCFRTKRLTLVHGPLLDRMSLCRASVSRILVLGSRSSSSVRQPFASDATPFERRNRTPRVRAAAENKKPGFAAGCTSHFDWISNSG